MWTSERTRHRIAARILAALALIACGIAVIVLVSATLSDDGGSDREGRTAKPRDERIDQPEVEGKTYVVQPGDTLTGVAEKSGVSLQRLQRLNPELDARILSPGQEIKLR